MTQVLETTDPDVAAEIFGSQYTAMRMRITGPRPLLRVARIPVGRASLDHSTFVMGMDGSADPVEQVMILRVRSGSVSYTCGGSEQTYGPGDTSFPLPLGTAWATSLRDVDSEIIVLDQALLDETVGGPPESGAPVRLLSPRPLSTASTAQLWRTATAIGSSITAQPDADQHPLVLSTAARFLAASVLAAFPNSAMVDATIEDRHDAHPDTLRRAVVFIEANPDRDIAVADIADAAFVTVRAVQLAFRRHLDTTPTAYLRRVRLHHAHAELLAANPFDGHTVSSVAARWGFFSPSRFAAWYRREFGESPSDTLRR